MDSEASVNKVTVNEVLVSMLPGSEGPVIQVSIRY